MRQNGNMEFAIAQVLFKEYICKHIIGMAIRLKFCKPPSAARDTPLGEKRKRERPRKE